MYKSGGGYREYTKAELVEMSQDPVQDGGMKLTVKRFGELTAEELFRLYRLRVEVFVVEQNCPYQEVDDADKEAYHIWLEDEGGIAAYMRVLPGGAENGGILFGRVIAKRRLCGLGSRIIAEGVRVAKERLGADTVYIKAQTQAQGFYEKCGFVKISDEFIEDGIPHIKMVRKL